MPEENAGKLKHWLIAVKPGAFAKVGLPLAFMLWLALSGVLIWAYGL